MFWATEKTTGQFFMATMIWDPEAERGRGPTDLGPSKSYLGHLFPGIAERQGSILVVHAREKMESRVLKGTALSPLNEDHVRLKAS